MSNPVVINDGLHVSGVTSAEEARIASAGPWARLTSGGVAARTGVVYGGVTSLLTGTAATGPMTISVSALHWVGAKSSAEGVYLGALQATTAVDVAAAPGSNSRIDVVYVMQEDQNATTSPDANTRGILGVATGTPAVSPTTPSIPVGAVEIGQLRVFAGNTATNSGVTITTTCKWTAPVGTPLPVRDATERGALTTYDGLSVYRLDTHAVERYVSGRGWLSNPGDRRSYVGAQSSGFTFTGAYQDVAGATLALPAGKFFVTAKGNTNVSTSAVRTYWFRLYDGAEIDSVVRIGTTNERAPFALAALGSYASPTTVRLQAYTPGVDGSQFLENGRIVAVPIADF